ncbi:MAG: reverse transcriptase domain-containing protein, partial [bacterium]
MPKISDLLQKLESFSYATALDLNMGYFTIRLVPDAQKLCTIILPWGKYKYLRLPLGVANSPDIFQDKMSALMVGLEFVRTYLDDLLV